MKWGSYFVTVASTAAPFRQTFLIDGSMNAGAAKATGDILLFLHADTQLPDNFVERVRTTLDQDGVSAGAFSLGIDSAAGGLRIIENVANWRSRVFQMPYGDQALFVHRKIFEEVGGYPDYPIMEDFEWTNP